MAHGVPIDLILMRDFHWTPAQIAQIPNRTVMEIVALLKLDDERAARNAS